MNTVSKLFINIDLFKQYNDVNNAKYVNQTISSEKINNWLAQLQKRRIGKTKDVDSSLATSANAMVALQVFNGFTQWTTNTPPDGIDRCSRDRWVYDTADCLSTEHTYQTPAT